MRKIYSLLLMAVMALGISFQANADLTIKVNKTGVVTLDANGQQNTLDEEVNVISGMSWIGSLLVDKASYTMTVTDETENAKMDVGEYDGNWCCNINPASTKDGHVLNVVVTESGGGGGEVEQQFITFVFSPAGSGYVVTTHTEQAEGSYEFTVVEDETYSPEEGSDEVDVPFDGNGSYLIKPNAGYTLQNAKDETQTSNPHYSGITPNPTDGFIHGQMGSLNAGSVIIVTATQDGSFSVMGVGNNIEHIQMQNLSSYEMVTVTSEAQNVSFAGDTQYKIYGDGIQLWKVEVTDSEDYTTRLEGNYGNFMYTPNAGDKVVIYTDMPDQYAQPRFTFEGQATKNIITKVMYGSTEQTGWDSDGFNLLIAGSEPIRIYYDATGLTNVTCTVNGTAATTGSDTENGSYFMYTFNNGDETIKEYDFVISAEKEQTYTVTLNCENPFAVTITDPSGKAFGFTQSGQTIKVSQSNNKIRISANNGYIVDGILVDGEAPEDGEFFDGFYFVKADCAITINITDKKALRNKTVVVYVDESVANPQSLELKFYGETSSQIIKPGYNFIKFADEDCPFSFGYYAGGDAQYYVNGVKISGSPMDCPETTNLEDGAVIKYFNGAPAQVVPQITVADEVKDMIEMFQDHTMPIDFSQEFLLFKGTIVHIKVKAAVVAANAPHRAAPSPIEVKVDDNVLQPDEDGVYSFTVGDTQPVISVTKAIQTGIDGITAEGGETFTIYNLQGMVVKANATTDDFNALPAGVYIANGAKVYVK